MANTKKAAPKLRPRKPSLTVPDGMSKEFAQHALEQYEAVTAYNADLRKQIAGMQMQLHRSNNPELYSAENHSGEKASDRVMNAMPADLKREATQSTIMYNFLSLLSNQNARWENSIGVLHSILVRLKGADGIDTSDLKKMSEDAQERVKNASGSESILKQIDAQLNFNSVNADIMQALLTYLRDIV